MWQKKWIFGNWKMNGRHAGNAALSDALKKLPDNPAVQIGIAVPFPYLSTVAETLHDTKICCGAQDCSRFADDGAHTGEVSAAMLADCKASFVLIGHSERRTLFGEDNALLRKKFDNATAASLIPLLCVGESLAEREAGKEEATVAAQLEMLNGLRLEKIALAYEPVWAIGTGIVADTAQIAAMHAFIYDQLLSRFGKDASIRLLYGGSVNAANARDILSIERVDGALVGGASLKADEFTRIAASVETE